jgi:hypothetical protein
MFVDNPNVKGTVAELEIAAAAARLGVSIWMPVTEHGRCDLLFEIGSHLWRVQCKWGRVSPSRDVVIVKTGGAWWSGSGYVRTTYTEAEIDLLAVYCGSSIGASCFRRRSSQASTRSISG